MPERQRFFSIDVFPKTHHFKKQNPVSPTCFSAKIWSTNGDGVVHPAEQICKVVFECLSKAICVTVEYLYALGLRMCYNLSALAESSIYTFFHKKMHIGTILLAVDCCDCY